MKKKVLINSHDDIREYIASQENNSIGKNVYFLHGFDTEEDDYVHSEMPYPLEGVDHDDEYPIMIINEWLNEDDVLGNMYIYVENPKTEHEKLLDSL